jgi:tripartite-type tricarboxylate transporter receptor subunit TctC
MFAITTIGRAAGTATVAVAWMGMISALLIGSQHAPAQAAGEFYRGKTIDLIIGCSPGGGYDAYARLLARHLGGHIPGNPRIVPRNMPGGGSRVAAQYVYNVAPKNGTVLATGDQSLALEQALGAGNIQFDTTRIVWIGNLNSDNNTLVTWHTSGIRTVDDAKTREVPVGATGADPSSQYPKVMNAILGTKFKVVLGYPGANEIDLAMENGEVAGRGSNSWGSWKATKRDWLRDKKINILVQIGLSKAPDLPDVPLLMDLAESNEYAAVLKLLSEPVAVGRPIFTTPDVPVDRANILRDAFDATIKDPVFLEEASKLNLSINASSGVELQQMVANIVNAAADTKRGLAGVLNASEGR